MSEALAEAEAEDRPGWSRSVSTWVGLAVGVVALLGLAGLQLRSGEKTDDAFVESSTVMMAPQIPGRVGAVHVVEHQRVEAGDLLVSLDRTEYELALEAARARLDSARNRIAEATASTASAEAEKRAALVELRQRDRELRRVKQLESSGATSQSALDAASAERDAAEARVRALGLRADAERALIGNEAPVLEAQAAVRSAELDLAHTEIRAPFDGVVGRKNVEPGAVVSPGQSLLLLVSDEDVWVMANFKETQIRHMRVGSKAHVRIDAYPGVEWAGHIDSFSPATGATYALIRPEPAAGNFTKVVQRVPVKIVLDATPTEDSEASAERPRLVAGLSAEVDVVVD
jgi:membrane fusion protein (multidrug efflux system)